MALGTPLNQVERVYNGFGQMTIEYQEHTGAVNTSTSKKVQYAYIEGASGANNSRLTGITYPTSTKVISYRYDGSALDGDISRLRYLYDGTNHIEDYTYLGLDTIVQKNDGDGVDLSYISSDSLAGSDGGDQYTGLDRFGRVIDQNWTTNPASSTSSKDRFQYGYDADGNVLYKDNMLSSNKSELYHANSSANDDNNTAYDALGRITEFRRGTLSASGKNGASADSYTGRTSISKTHDLYYSSNYIIDSNGDPVYASTGKF